MGNGATNRGSDMKTVRTSFAGVVIVTLFCTLLPLASASGQDEVVGFDPDSWVLVNAEIVDHMDRKGLIGFALLKDIEFENGVIEVDVAVDGTRSYPGIVFRVQSQRDYERIYIRPHRAGLYPDALQYTPVFNGIAGWQLYNGEGYTASVSFPADEWVYVRIEVAGNRARVFIADSDKPALVIDDLKHGLSKGSIGVFGPRNKTACFSNFRYRTDVDLEFDLPPPIETPPGMITEWQLSGTRGISQVDEEEYPGVQELAGIGWHAATSEASGLLDVSRYFGRGGREPDCIFAKTTLTAERDETKKFVFGYSDRISIFLNGELLFLGSSLYQERDPSFLGVVSLSDAIYLPLKEGENELLLLVTETFGGWGLMFQDATVVYQDDCLKGLWQTDKEFLVPESVAYDPQRDVLYVSNLDAYNRSAGEERQFVSKISPDGEIKDLKWVTGLSNPTGLAVSGNRLFVVERRGLTEIDTESGTILQTHQLSQAMFPNDVTVDESGYVYVSDSRKSVIYRLADGAIEEWLAGDEIESPNGLHAHGNKLIVGNNGDRSIKSVDIGSKNITTIAKLGPGIIDGIKTDEDGNYIVSQTEGRVYRISPAGELTKLLDTSTLELYAADFEYIAGKHLLVIPTFVDNGVVAYELTE
jgi:sugar lactone lactonase YvrE